MAVLALIVDAYSLVVLAAVVLSWLRLPEDNVVVRVVGKLTEPVFRPIRRVLPDLGGLDLSAMVVLLALRLLRWILIAPGA